MQNQLIVNQEKIIRMIETMGDILVHETLRKKGISNIEESLNKLEDITANIFQLKNKNPSRFNQIMFSKDFLNVFNTDKDKANRILSYSTFNQREGFFVTFSTILNQILRIHDAGIKAQNNAVCERASLYYIRLIYKLTEIGVLDFVRLILEKSYFMTKNLTKQGSTLNYELALGWYVHIVLRTENPQYIWNIKDYLNLFDTHVLFQIKYMIETGNKLNFEDFISDLVTYVGSRIHILEVHDAYNYWSTILNFNKENFEKLLGFDKKNHISQRITSLDEKKKLINSTDELEKWINEFKLFKEELAHFVNDKQLEENLIEIENEIINEAYYYYLYNDIIEITFEIGAYCLFEKRYDYIKYIWERKQPPDAGATWGGKNIYPDKVNDLFIFYFNKSSSHREPKAGWKDRHGHEGWYVGYFILLLAKLLQMQGQRLHLQGQRLHYEEKTPEEKTPLNNNLLTILNISKLNNMEYLCGTYINRAESWKCEKEVLEHLGIEIKVLDEVKQLFENVKNLAKGEEHRRIREKPISENKIQNYIKGFLEGFKRASIMRSIISEYGIIEKRLDEKPKSEIPGYILETCLINKISEKEEFFEDWDVSYPSSGTNEGFHIASQEDQHIFLEMKEHCKQCNSEEFNQVLSSINDPSDFIIISSSIGAYNFFTKFRNEELLYNNPPDDIKGFFGWYEYKGIKIPVIKLSHYLPERFLILVRKSTIGKLVQYSPINKENKWEDAKSIVEEIFYISIKALSDDEELRKEYIKDKPQWLIEQGGENQQDEYLKRLVWTVIRERPEYKSPKEFEGYYFNLENNDE